MPITFPSNASGNYNIAAVSETSASGAGTGRSGHHGRRQRHAAGNRCRQRSLLGLWVGGGALVLAGGAVALAAAVRRNRKEHAGV